MSRNHIPTIKVCILGETGVGKTCLSTKLVKDDEYNHNYLQEPTIGASFMCKNYKYNNKTYKINIWDTAGQERYRSLASMYYRDVVVAIIVYDVTDYDSWNELEYWVGEVVKNSPKSSILLVGNKFDLKEDIKIELSDIDEFIIKYDNVKHIFFSAKVGYSNSKILDLVAEDFQDKVNRGVLFDIPLYSPKNTIIKLDDKGRYWCSTSLNNMFSCC